MALFRSFNEIVNSIRERLRLTQPNLDTKPGTVANDLFIEPQAEQIEKLHRSLLVISEKQSFATATGDDLDKLAKNFLINRKGGSFAAGNVVVTVPELNSDILIPSNTTVVTRNGLTFSTIGNFIFSASEKSRHAAIASRLRRQLNLAGITDQYAIEVPVRANFIGRVGNIPPYQVVSSNIIDAVNIINLSSFSGGDDIEGDAAFRARILGFFGGAVTGTASGYRNAALSVTGVLDALVVEPGNAIMQRDGTETIKTNDNSFRILNSGTGGKVDLYILGKSLSDNSESYIYIDKSFSGDPTDERNNYIPGITFIDNNLTTQERRLLAFRNGIIPLQPIDSIISVSGSSSGLLIEKFVDSEGNTRGNYEFVKDLNVDSGGSPFGYDYIKFISNFKNVENEVIIKETFNGVDPVQFTDVLEVNSVYQDLQIRKENAKILNSNRRFIQLRHKPVVNVSRVLNFTTGEVYNIISQNINSQTGLNNDGVIEISGKTLPTTADILSVDYTWRNFFDKYTDFNGATFIQDFKDENVNDSIDWGKSNGIFSEEGIITKDSNDFEYRIETQYNISRVLNVFSATKLALTINNNQIIIPNDQNIINNIVSIKNASNIELYNSSVTFNNRVIYLPNNIEFFNGEQVTVTYNKIELYSFEDANGSYSSNIITLPSEDILTSANILNIVEDLFATEEVVYIKYIANLNKILPLSNLSTLPIFGDSNSDNLSLNNLSIIGNSTQPILYNVINNEKISIKKFGPTKLKCNLSGINRPGKIKITGTTFSRMTLKVFTGNSYTNNILNLRSAIIDNMTFSSESNLGIARVEKVYVPVEDYTYDIQTYSLFNNEYDLSFAKLDTTLSPLSVKLPNTETNQKRFSSATEIEVTLLVYNKNNFEEMYFAESQINYTNSTFATIDRITISSGFRNSSGAIIGTIEIEPLSQPTQGSTYSANYDFSAPKEGERITVRYNTNALIADVTRAIEEVRTITADVLVKEATELAVDAEGEILINENAEESKEQIIENVISAVSNLLNTGILGSTINYSDIINTATSVTGVRSANITLFNLSGQTGRRSFVTALENQTIVAGNINFISVSSKNFKIT